MKNLIFATQNQHKIEEAVALAGASFTIQGLCDLDFHGDIPETADTFAGNALLKAEFVYQQWGIDCFSDDTGLEIDALDGRPGVISARYAGEPCNPQKNLQKVLDEMQGITNRKARFKTVIALIYHGKRHLFEGVVEGEITHAAHGTKGFGYDSIFRPEGYDQTFGEMSEEAKNAISHRGEAMRKLMEFLKKSL